MASNGRAVPVVVGNSDVSATSGPPGPTTRGRGTLGERDEETKLRGALKTHLQRHSRLCRPEVNHRPPRARHPLNIAMALRLCDGLGVLCVSKIRALESRRSTSRRPFGHRRRYRPSVSLCLCGSNCDVFVCDVFVFLCLRGCDVAWTAIGFRGAPPT